MQSLEFRSRHLGGCQNYAPFLGTLNNRCRIIIGTQKGAIKILTTTQVFAVLRFPEFGGLDCRL